MCPSATLWVPVSSDTSTSGDRLELDRSNPLHVEALREKERYESIVMCYGGKHVFLLSWYLTVGDTVTRGKKGLAGIG